MHVIGTITEYRGIEFKSLHELAWAKFFTKERLKWSYEPTRFYTGRESYTPDFLIDGVYIEIKAYRATNLNKFYLCPNVLLIIYGKPDKHYIHLKPAGAAAVLPRHIASWTRAYQKVFV
jgi:hypothetical protein